jgi:5-methylthioribose kinase
VGIAHVEDLESIADPDVRALCEKPALNFGKMLLREPSQFCSIEGVASALESPIMIY